MDDYYELLDVAPDADRDDIKTAYRTLRDELVAADGETNRAEVARLNRAWNVLSDPAQRERYDDRLAEYRESDDEDDDRDDDDGAAPVVRTKRPPSTRSSGKAAPKTRAEQRAAAREARMQPTLELPDGLVMAPVKSRLSALGFDIAVLLLIFVTCQFIGVKVINDRYPRQTDRIDAINHSVKALDKKIDAAATAQDVADGKAEAAAAKNDDAAEAKAKSASAKAKAEEASLTKKRDALAAESKKLNSKLKPATTVVFAISMLLVLFYLVPSTALSGQTVGKRLRKIRVVKLDGSVPGWVPALKRFGLPLLVATALSPIFGPLGLAVVLIGMVGWISQPNKQGLHDRLAKTVVVEA
jgi:curved DNA-binding protein CbpA